MTTSLLAKARANRIVALNSLARRNGSNVYSLEDARKRRQAAAPIAVAFTSCRAA